MSKIIDAATAIVVSETSKGLEVLMLQRNPELKFMGGFWVFPGGAFEPQDYVACSEQTAKNAAVRETFEEAGIQLNAEALYPFDYWLTPDISPKRFSTWFYLALVDKAEVTIDGSEIVDYQWLSPRQAINQHRSAKAEMMPPTLVSLLFLQQCENLTALKKQLSAKPYQYYRPKMVIDDKQVVMLYHGDAGFEQQEANLPGPKHRCVLGPNGWEYIKAKA